MITLERKIDWQAQLVRYIVETAAIPFEPGKMDCALWVAGAVEVMTGHDFAKDFRGYTTIAGGYKKLKAAGYDDHVALVAASLPEAPAPSFGQVGDVAVLDREDAPLGLIQGEMIYCAAPEGRALVSLLEAKRVFRV